MAKIKVYFEATVTYAAEFDYGELVRLAEGNGNPEGAADFIVPPEGELAPGREFDVPRRWAGPELSENLWALGSQVDSTETRVTGLMGVG